jgi:hypothetical protein
MHPRRRAPSVWISLPISGIIRSTKCQSIFVREPRHGEEKKQAEERQEETRRASDEDPEKEIANRAKDEATQIAEISRRKNHSPKPRVETIGNRRAEDHVAAQKSPVATSCQLVGYLQAGICMLAVRD